VRQAVVRGLPGTPLVIRLGGLGHERERFDAIQVRAGREQARDDGVRQPVLGLEDHDAARAHHVAVAAVGHRIAAADAGRDVEQHGALTQAGIAVHQRQLPEREPPRPQPAHHLRHDRGEPDTHGGWPD
jgi:hypothetical protein